MKNGISTNEDKSKALKACPRPNNLSQLRMFSAHCTYYRRFVPSFADVANILYDLTRGTKEIVLLVEQEESFKNLKKMLCETQVLAYPQPGKTFGLDTDGGVLICSASSLNISGKAGRLQLSLL